jgi:shikimate kinase
MANIVLTGFMCTGKSEVGRRLAKRLGRPFVDTDQLIEQRADKTVAAIFRDDGEPEFRAFEREAVAAAAADEDTVIAVGGGAILDPTNVERLRARGIIVCLSANTDTILRRVGDVSRRPLLAGGDPRGTVERLLAERGPAYERAADVTVDTSDRKVGEVVERVHEEIGRLERTNRWKSST